MSLRELLVEAYSSGTKSIDVASRLHDALPARPLRALSVSVLAVGKAAPAMAQGALERWGPYLERLLVVAPDDVPFTLTDPRAELIRAAHPLPDERSVLAAERAIELARGAQGLLTALVSGGASSLLCLPCEGLTLADKREVIAALLASSATIREVNTVRRHLSRIKGGGLTRAAAPTHTLAFLVSDVIGGGAHDVGSGPTVPDPTTAAEARAILLHHARRFRRVQMRETLKPGDPEASLQKVRTVLSPDDLARAVAERLVLAGFTVRLLEASTADVESMASEYRELADELAPKHAIVRAAEPSLAVDVSRPGRGGRCTHLATLLAHTLPRDVAFLAGASDGVDGASGTAGAVVDREFAATIDEQRCDEALRHFDTACLHEDAGTALKGGPTGINLADVHVLARA
jgi:hydroxypyruvate reductase